MTQQEQPPLPTGWEREMEEGWDEQTVAIGRAFYLEPQNVKDSVDRLTRAGYRIETATPSPSSELAEERLAEALQHAGFVRGVATRYGVFNDAYWQECARVLIDRARLQEQE